MYQFELFRVALANGQHDIAKPIMKVITDHNKDDCLSTKLLCDWLRVLDFETVDKIVQVGK